MVVSSLLKRRDMTTVDTERVRTLMISRNLDVTGLASAAGISRQAVYRFLRAGYDPFPSGFSAVATALGVSPEYLLSHRISLALVDETLSLLQSAALGEARAFEVLPATLSRFSVNILDGVTARAEEEHRLLAAAGAICQHISSKRQLGPFIEKHASRCQPGRAFFFSHRMMDAERIVSDTPPQMKKHNVFGSFRIDDFARHLG